MKVYLIKPDGSMILHPNMQGIAEPGNGDLLLLHQDGSQRLYVKGTWTKFKGEKELDVIDIRPIPEHLVDAVAVNLAEKLEMP